MDYYRKHSAKHMRAIEAYQVIIKLTWALEQVLMLPHHHCRRQQLRLCRFYVLGPARLMELVTWSQAIDYFTEIPKQEVIC